MRRFIVFLILALIAALTVCGAGRSGKYGGSAIITSDSATAVGFWASSPYEYKAPARLWLYSSSYNFDVSTWWLDSADSTWSRVNPVDASEDTILHLIAGVPHLITNPGHLIYITPGGAGEIETLWEF